MNKFYKVVLATLLCLSLVAMLAACGDTATPAATTVASTTAAATTTTAATTTAATTTVAATTAPATTAATTTAATTAASTTTAASGSANTPAAGSNWTQINISDLTSSLAKNYPTVSDFDAAMYASPDDPSKTVTDAQSVVTQAGYNCTTVSKDAGGTGVLCLQSGKPDIIYVVLPVDPASVASITGNISSSDLATINSALANAKSVILLEGGTGLLSASSSATTAAAGATTTAASTDTSTPSATTTAASTDTSAATTTAAVTAASTDTSAATTTAAASGTSSVSGDAGSNWTQVDLSADSKTALLKSIPTQPSDADVALFVSPDDITTTLQSAQTLVSSAGYTCQIMGSGTNSFGICTASGKPDLVYAGGALTDLPTGLTSADVAKVQALASTNKSGIVLYKGTGIAQAITSAMSNGGSATTTAASSTDTSTPSATTTAAS